MIKSDLTGLRNFTNQVKQAKKQIENIDTILDKLAELGRKTIQEAHDTIYSSYGTSFKGEHNEKTTVIVRNEGNTRVIEASGNSVLFIEYGTGVTFNTPQSDRPPHISNIGEYGKGYGKRKVWGYKVGDTLVKTRGNKAATGITKAIEAIEEELPKLLKGGAFTDRY